ncbi:MAG TPA: hypothetical protein PKE47_06910 [Verrucomicrobiota bacterium]|nr:hypothetical protein [Verrucomicrobiota bacterium]
MSRTASALRWTARSLSLLVLAFWGFFLAAHLLGDAGQSSRPLAVRDAAQIAAMLLGLAGLALAWRYELAGAVVTLASAAVAACLNPRAMTGLAALPLVAALLFLIAWRIGRAASPQPAA